MWIFLNPTSRQDLKIYNKRRSTNLRIPKSRIKTLRHHVSITLQECSEIRLPSLTQYLYCIKQRSANKVISPLSNESAWKSFSETIYSKHFAHSIDRSIIRFLGRKNRNTIKQTFDALCAEY